MPRNGTKNLVPQNKRAKEEQKKIATMGGVASGIARREKKNRYQLAEAIVNAELQGKNKEVLKKQFPELEENDLTTNALMMSGLVRSAIRGNVQAFEKLNEYQAKSEQQDQTSEYTVPILDITRDFVEAYRELHEAYNTGKWRTFIFKGGRGSVKSNFVSAFAEETIYQDPEAHVVFTRRYKTDLRGSVYNQFQKTIIRHKKQDEWEFTTAPMCATYIKTGQKVMFVGCDKPISLKSYNLPFGYVKLLVNEEADEMAGMEQMDNVEDTFLRSNTNAVNIKIFNPPKSSNNFMNEYTANPPDKCYICHSFYTSVPVEWLGQRFFDRAEWFKINKPMYYANNYMGEVTGTGGMIFDNVEYRTITDAEINTFSNFYHGLDFGYQHPQAFIECSYDRESDTVYVTYEHTDRHMKQEKFAKQIERFKPYEIICDSANPDKIADYCDYGFNAIGAVKRWQNKGREYAWEWLSTRTKIVVDKLRSPNIAEELRKAEYEQLRDGTFTSRVPDIGEDSIMALIYSLNRVIMEEKEI